MASPTTTAGGIPDWAIRELERPDTDDQVLALLAQLRPDTAELAGAQLRRPIRYRGQTVQGRMSVGWAVFPDDAAGSVELQMVADLALNQVKVDGGGQIRRYRD